MRSHRAIHPRQGAGRGDQGFVMITVVLISSIMFLLLAVVTQDAVSNMSLSRHSQDWNAALGSAQAGASDFVYRLNANEAYSYCVALKTQPVGPPDPANCAAIPTPPATTGGNPGWGLVPNVAGTRLSCFTYSIPSYGLISGSAGAGTSDGSAILLDVTGIVINGPNAVASCSKTAIATRKIRLTITRTTYLNYAYFTDVETQDPAQYDPKLSSEFNADPTALADAYQYCSNYYFALSVENAALLAKGKPAVGGSGLVKSTDLRSAHSSLGTYTTYTSNNICTYTKFGGDNFNGPVHTNDVFSFDNPTTFSDVVEVGHDASETLLPSLSAPTCGSYPPATNSILSNFGRGDLWIDAHFAVYGTNFINPVPGQGFYTTPPSSISCRAPIPLPAKNSTLKQQAIASGCLYSGLTSFYFEPSGAIDVYSPGTVGSAGANCPASGVVPNSAFNGVIFVQDLPSTAPSCTLSTAGNNKATGAVKKLGAIIQDNDLNQLENDPTGKAGKSAQAYDCNNGDAFVGGQMTGQLTVGTDNNVIIYQNLLYSDDTGTTLASNSNNVLGLEPVGNVQIYHPVSCPGWTAGAITKTYLSCATGTSNILAAPATPSSCAAMTACQTNYVQSAILAFNGEFTNENWSYGPGLGTINSTGSVTQGYRGRMAGTGNGSGYGKSYSYDTRMAFITPPYFLPPDVFSWTPGSFAETTTDTAN